MFEWQRDNSDDVLIMSRDEVRAFDAWAIEQMGVPGAVLMENAAGNCTRLILEQFSDACAAGVCVFCGCGNNGGDGFVVARQLYNAGVSVKIVIGGDAAKIGGDAKVNFEIAKKMGLPMSALEMDSADLCRAVELQVEGCGLIVDAVLGTGLQGQLKESAALLISAINSHNVPIMSVDIPSGLDCDTGMPLPVCIEAAVTVTFVAVKKGFAANPDSRQATGRVFVADIGITKKS